MAPRPAPLQRYATAAIHPSDSSEKLAALKSRSRSVMPAKARSVSIEPPPRPGLQRQATTAVHKIHEAQTSAAGTAVTESRYSKHARNLSLQNRKPSTRRSLKKLSSFRLSGAAGRRVSDGMDADDAEWLQSMMPDDMTLSATRFSDDSFLTELFTADELKWAVPSALARVVGMRRAATVTAMVWWPTRQSGRSGCRRRVRCCRTRSRRSARSSTASWRRG